MIEAIAIEERMKDTYERMRNARQGGNNHRAITLQVPSDAESIEEMWDGLKVTDKVIH